MANGIEDAFNKASRLSCDYRSDWADDVGIKIETKIKDVCDSAFSSCQACLYSLSSYRSIDVNMEKEKALKILEELNSIDV